MSEKDDEIRKAAKPPEVQRAPEAAQQGAVIGDSGKQADWRTTQQAHYLDQDESATGLFFKPGETSKSTCKFAIEGLDDEPPQSNADGSPYKVYRQVAKQAQKKLDPLSQELTEGVYQSSVKLNVQITNVPEVGNALSPDDGLKYTSTVMEAGAAAVHETERHLAEPDAINNDLIHIAEHFSHDANQFNNDVKTAVTGTMEQIDKPMSPEERAKLAGSILPLFFFEGEKGPIHPEVAQEMNLEKMTEEELKSLGIESGSYQFDQTTGRIQRTDLGKIREPYKWETLNEWFSADAIRQSGEASCISTVGEMLTEGRLSENSLLKTLGAPSIIERLPEALGDGWSKETRRFKSLAEIGEHGSWAAEMMETGLSKKPPHVVVVDGVTSSDTVLIRDPLEGTKYQVKVKHFVEDIWTGRAVYRTKPQI